LFYGLFANDATETSAELAIRYHNQHGRSPNKRELVELYYGEYVNPLDLFIGFDKFCMFDVPLLTTGAEDLYFTVSPSLYLTQAQLREILFDHLYTRRIKETDYSDMPPSGWSLMRQFYKVNQGKTIGVGAKQEQGEYWYPLPQVELPVNFR
jgi:tuberculosinol/isotuberculosinol synthase